MDTQSQFQPQQSTFKKRALFWIIAPASFIGVGLVLGFVNRFTPLDSPVHVIINLVTFLFIYGGIVAFVPGMVYGIVLLRRR